MVNEKWQLRGLQETHLKKDKSIEYKTQAENSYDEW